MLIELENHVISKDGPAFLIAEACDNHFGSLDAAFALVEMAHEAGWDAVKFQHHIVEEEMVRNIGAMSANFSERLEEFLDRCALSFEQHKLLHDHCSRVGVAYMCTPFSVAAAQEISDLVSVFKIGSGEFLDFLGLRKIIAIGKPLLLSTGMCDLVEIDACVNFLEKNSARFALMNCVSEYPPKYEDLNLDVISLLIDRYPNILIGHSDHSQDIYTSIAAVTLGAKIVEKHISLSSFLAGPDSSVSIDFDQMKELAKGVRQVERPRGAKKMVHEAEGPVRAWAHRSILSSRELSEGHVVVFDDLTSKRPGIGIPSMQYTRVIGKTLARSVEANHIFSDDDFV